MRLRTERFEVSIPVPSVPMLVVLINVRLIVGIGLR